MRAALEAQSALWLAGGEVDATRLRFADEEGVRTLFARLEPESAFLFLIACDAGKDFSRVREGASLGNLAAARALGAVEDALAKIWAGSLLQGVGKEVADVALARDGALVLELGGILARHLDALGSSPAGARLRPQDASLAAAERRFAQILASRNLNDVVFHSRDSLGGLPPEAQAAQRMQALAVLAQDPSLTLYRLAAGVGGDVAGSIWDSVAFLKAMARGRNEAFAKAFGAEPAKVAGAVETFIGLSLHLPPGQAFAQMTAAELQAAMAHGENLYRGSPAESQISRIAQSIRDLGGTEAEVVPLALQVSGREFGTYQTTIWKVRDARTGAERIVDDQGRTYNSLAAWREANYLPPGLVTMPAGSVSQRDDFSVDVALHTERTGTHRRHGGRSRHRRDRPGGGGRRTGRCRACHLPPRLRPDHRAGGAGLRSLVRRPLGSEAPRDVPGRA